MLHFLRDVQCYLLDRVIMPRCLRDVQCYLLDRAIMPHNSCLFFGDMHCSLYDRTIMSHNRSLYDRTVMSHNRPFFGDKHCSLLNRATIFIQYDTFNLRGSQEEAKERQIYVPDVVSATLFCLTAAETRVSHNICGK